MPFQQLVFSLVTSWQQLADHCASLCMIVNKKDRFVDFKHNRASNEDVECRGGPSKFNSAGGIEKIKIESTNVLVLLEICLTSF